MEKNSEISEKHIFYDHSPSLIMAKESMAFIDREYSYKALNNAFGIGKGSADEMIITRERFQGPRECIISPRM